MTRLKLTLCPNEESAEVLSVVTLPLNGNGKWRAPGFVVNSADSFAARRSSRLQTN